MGIFNTPLIRRKLRELENYLKNEIKKEIKKVTDYISNFDEKERDRLFLLAKEKLKFMRWTAIDTYMIRMFIGALFGSLLLFVAIYQLTQIFTDLRWLPAGSNFVLVVQFYAYNALYWSTILSPFSFLFATVYVLSRMAQQRELVAIVSTGTSMFRASIYLVIFSILSYIFVVGLFQNAVVFPAYQKKYILGEIIFQKVDPKKLDELKNNSSFSIFGENNLIYIIGMYNAVTKEMNNVTIVQLKNSTSPQPSILTTLTNQNIWLLTNAEALTKQRDLIYPEELGLSLRIDATKATWDNARKRWVMERGAIRYVKNSGETFDVQFFTNRSFDFIVDPPYYFEKIWYPMDAMTYEEGRSYIDKLRKSHQDYKGEKARFLMKFSYSLGIIFVVLAGIGIVDMSKRKVSFINNLMISLGLFAIYYVIFAIGSSLASKGNLIPEVGAFTGSFFFLIVAILMYRRVRT